MRGSSLVAGRCSRLSSFVFRLSSLYFLISIFFFFIFLSPAHAYSRIISLKPNITEIVFALGEGGKLVGVTRFCTLPPVSESIPRVADYIRIDVEKTLAQKPDLILASRENASRKEVEFLKNHGVTVELLNFDRLEEIRESTLRLGNLLGEERKAHALVSEMDRGLSTLKTKAEQVKPLRAIFIVGYEPLVVVGGNNFIGEIFSYLGLKNVAEQSRMPYPVYSLEQLLQSAPELIVDLAMGTEATAAKRAERKNWWNRFPSVPAVKQGRIYYFEIEKIRAVPELPRSLEELFSRIHGSV